MIDAGRGAVSTMIGMTLGQRIGTGRDIIIETMWRTFGYITNTGRDVVIIGVLMLSYPWIVLSVAPVT